MIQWKLGIRNRKPEASEAANRKARSLTLSLVYSSASACDSDNAVFTCKRRSHKQNQCSASKSVGLIFTRSYRSSLLVRLRPRLHRLWKPALKCRLRERMCIYLKLLYGSFHSSLVASSFSSTCIFSSRSRLFSFIINVSIGNLSEILWESGIRTRFSFRNLGRKKRKSCRNFWKV